MIENKLKQLGFTEVNIGCSDYHMVLKNDNCDNLLLAEIYEGGLVIFTLVDSGYKPLENSSEAKTN